MTNHSAAPAAPHSADALKPCPFCGCDDIRVHLDWSMMCANCGAEGALMDTQDAAIAAWNRRPTPADCESKTGEWSACQLRTIELYNMIHNRRPLNAERINTTPASPGLDNEAAARLRKQAEEAKKVRGVVALSPEDAFALLDRVECAEADRDQANKDCVMWIRACNEANQRAEAAAGAVPEGTITGDEVTALAHKLIRELTTELGECEDDEALNYCARGIGSLNADILTFIKNRAAPPAQGLPVAPKKPYLSKFATLEEYKAAMREYEAATTPAAAPSITSLIEQHGSILSAANEQSRLAAAPSEPVAWHPALKAAADVVMSLPLREGFDNDACKAMAITANAAILNLATPPAQDAGTGVLAQIRAAVAKMAQGYEYGAGYYNQEIFINGLREAFDLCDITIKEDWES